MPGGAEDGAPQAAVPARLYGEGLGCPVVRLLERASGARCVHGGAEDGPPARLYGEGRGCAVPDFAALDAQNGPKPG
jgi:hypothetical protein